MNTEMIFLIHENSNYRSADHSALIYAGLTEFQPERIIIVGVTDPNVFAEKYVERDFVSGREMMFESAAELAGKGTVDRGIFQQIKSSKRAG